MKSIFQYLLSFTICITIACTKKTELVREIEYRILQDSTQKDPNILGGVKIGFRYCDEFAFDIDSILPQMKIQIPFEDTSYTSTIDEKGKWFVLEGLQPFGIYSSDVMYGGITHYKYRFSGSGNNDYYYFKESMPLIETSNSIVKNVNAEFEYDSIAAKVLSIKIDVIGLEEDSIEDSRGAIIFISDEPNPNEKNALILRNYLTKESKLESSGKVYTGEIRISREKLGGHFVRGQSIYFKVHGVSGFYYGGEQVVKYVLPTGQTPIELDENYSNKNHVSINGEIEME